MASRRQTETYEKINASAACSVCDHVWLEHSAIGLVARCNDHFVVGCGEDCLYSDQRTIVRADHLYGRTDQFLPLLHLPLFGKATKISDVWQLGILNDTEGEVADSFYVEQSIESAFSKDDTCFAMFALGGLHFEALYKGARVVPIWQTLEEAEEYRKSRHLMSRMLLKPKEIIIEELLAISLRDSHNYLAINHSDTTRECLIIDEHLNIDENTLQL